MTSSSLFTSIFLAALNAVNVVKAAQTITVCSAGECITGQSNITRLGAALNTQSNAYLLLPGQYAANVQPTSLSQALTSATATVTFTTGFSNSTTATSPSLPLNVALQPGLLNYPSDLYTGDPSFIPLPQSINSTFNPTSINRGSIILAANTVAAVEADNNGVKNRVVLWDTVPFISQLPYTFAGNLRILSLLSSSCSPACSNNGICTVGGSCLCPTGFNGASCEECSPGFFGPQCTPCPSGCGKCDEGINGSGTCLTPQLPANAPRNCNCQSGTCNGSGPTATCTCSTGWVTASNANSTQCASCDVGFYRDPDGNCKACGARCQRCADNTGSCTQCESGLSPNSQQPQVCAALQTCGPRQYPDPTSSNGCGVCNNACATCKGPGAGDCLTCQDNTFLLGGRCVTIGVPPASGVCTGTKLVGNPNSLVCDTCPLGCDTCSYDVFTPASVPGDVKCSKCLPGLVLTGGKCAETCPEGTFDSNGVCQPCDSSCSSCRGSATFCVTCRNNQLASSGTCVSSCPRNMFSSNGTCKSCHPDCATCSGPGFNQCSACPESSPILTNGRCLKTCAKSEYFDGSSSSCKSCDSSCGSCSGGGSKACLSCGSNKQVLRAGECLNVNCGNNQGTTSGLGVCLAQELVQVPNNSGTPPVAIPPIDPNAQQPSSGGGKKLLWWQILLIVLGALLLLVLILICWRRRARQKRAKETEQFKHNLKHQGLWAKLWRNPFAAWWARRRSAALARRSQDVEQMSYAKDWKSNSSSADRRTAVGVPKSISRGSWVTMGQHTERRGSFDGRSYFTNNAGLGVIREDRRHDDQWERAREPSERSYGRSYKNGASSYSDGESRRYREPPRGESQYYGQEIEQEDVRSERTYDPYQYPRPSSRTSDDLVSMIKSEYTEGDRYDDRLYNQARNHPRDNRSLRQDYPQSVTTRRTQSRHYQYDDARSYGRKTRGESPSMYSQSTGFPPPHSRQMPPIAFPEEPVRDAVLSSRFSMSTTAASTHPPSKNLRKSPPAEPVPQLTEPPRQLTDAEMYKMSKLFPELLKLVSPTKKEHSPQQTTNPSPSRNPFRTFI